MENLTLFKSFSSILLKNLTKEFLTGTFFNIPPQRTRFSCNHKSIFTLFVRAQYVEARCAGVTCLLTGLVWLAWVLTCVTLDTATDLVTSTSLLATVIITFLSMFITPRIIPDNSGYQDCYQSSRKMEQFTVLPGNKLKDSFHPIHIYYVRLL